MLVLGALEVILLHRLRFAQFNDGGSEPLLRFAALANVADADSYTQIVLALAINRTPVRRSPQQSAVLTPRTKFEILPCIAAQRLTDLADSARDVGGIDEPGRKIVHGQTFFRRIAKSVQHSRVKPYQSTLGADP